MQKKSRKQSGGHFSLSLSRHNVCRPLGFYSLEFHSVYGRITIKDSFAECKVCNVAVDVLNEIYSLGVLLALINPLPAIYTST